MRQPRDAGIECRPVEARHVDAEGLDELRRVPVAQPSGFAQGVVQIGRTKGVYRSAAAAGCRRDGVAVLHHELGSDARRRAALGDEQKESVRRVDGVAHAAKGEVLVLHARCSLVRHRIVVGPAELLDAPGAHVVAVEHRDGRRAPQDESIGERFGAAARERHDACGDLQAVPVGQQIDLVERAVEDIAATEREPEPFEQRARTHAARRCPSAGQEGFPDAVLGREPVRDVRGNEAGGAPCEPRRQIRIGDRASADDHGCVGGARRERVVDALPDDAGELVREHEDDRRAGDEVRRGWLATAWPDGRAAREQAHVHRRGRGRPHHHAVEVPVEHGTIADRRRACAGGAFVMGGERGRVHSPASVDQMSLGRTMPRR